MISIYLLFLNYPSIVLLHLYHKLRKETTQNKVKANGVYACYSLFIPFGTGIFLTKGYPEFVLAIQAAVIVNDDLDYCRSTNNRSHFCNIYYGIIVEKQIPKFRSINCIHVLTC